MFIIRCWILGPNAFLRPVTPASIGEKKGHDIKMISRLIFLVKTSFGGLFNQKASNPGDERNWNCLLR